MGVDELEDIVSELKRMDPVGVMLKIFWSSNEVMVGAIDDALEDRVRQDDTRTERPERRSIETLDRLFTAPNVQSSTKSEIFAVHVVLGNPVGFGFGGFGESVERRKVVEVVKTVLTPRAKVAAWVCDSRLAAWAAFWQIGPAFFVIRNYPRW